MSDPAIRAQKLVDNAYERIPDDCAKARCGLEAAERVLDEDLLHHGMSRTHPANPHLGLYYRIRVGYDMLNRLTERERLKR